MTHKIPQHVKDRLAAVDADSGIPQNMKAIYKEKVLNQMVQRNEGLTEEINP